MNRRLFEVAFTLVTLALTFGGAIPAILQTPLIAAVILLAGGTIATGLVVYWQISMYRRGKPQYFRSEAAINQYMHDWISKGGRVAIFSRDLTWAQGDSANRALLFKKAKRDELAICVPKRNQLVSDLEREGAEVYTYSEIMDTSRSRFTVIRHGRSDARVAIGRTVEGAHVVEEFSAGDHPAFAMAEDLLDLVKRFHVRTHGGTV